MIEERYYTYNQLCNLLSFRHRYPIPAYAGTRQGQGAFAMGDELSSTNNITCSNFNGLSSTGMSSTNHSGSAVMPYVYGFFSFPRSVWECTERRSASRAAPAPITQPAEPRKDGMRKAQIEDLWQTAHFHAACLFLSVRLGGSGHAAGMPFFIHPCSCEVHSRRPLAARAARPSERGLIGPQGESKASPRRLAKRI